MVSGLSWSVFKNASEAEEHHTVLAGWIFLGWIASTPVLLLTLNGIGSLAWTEGEGSL